MGILTSPGSKPDREIKSRGDKPLATSKSPARPVGYMSGSGFKYRDSLSLT